MPAEFNRDDLARWYARQHLKTDPGIHDIYYLKDGAPEREIRFLEINSLLCSPSDNLLQPIDFGVDTGMESAHKLYILDVTTEQWDQIQNGKLSLPAEWSLEGAESFGVNAI